MVPTISESMRSLWADCLLRGRRASLWRDSRGGCRHMSFEQRLCRRMRSGSGADQPQQRILARPQQLRREPTLRLHQGPQSRSRRSAARPSVCARMADVPSRLSSGVLSQNNARARQQQAEGGNNVVALAEGDACAGDHGDEQQSPRAVFARKDQCAGTLAAVSSVAASASRNETLTSPAGSTSHRWTSPDSRARGS